MNEPVFHAERVRVEVSVFKLYTQACILLKTTRSIFYPKIGLLLGQEAILSCVFTQILDRESILENIC